MDKPTTSRKFIDLIFHASSKWANWNPPHEIKVGDYGKLDRQTGEFKRKGNIYEDESMAELVKDHPPKPAAREEVYIAASAKVTRNELTLGAEVEIPGLAEASIKGQWAFGSTRGALLIMAHPRTSYIPRDTILKDLAEAPTLKDMLLVTEVFACPAYSLYLSSGNSEVVNLALLGSFPVPHAPGVTVGGEVDGKWWVQNTNGLFRSACGHHGKDDFTPLYMLKGIRKKSLFSRRGEKPPPEREGDDLWGDVQVPWDPLDEDGNEDVFEDTVFD
jgi:hypothetical protein